MCFDWLTITNTFANRSHIRYEFPNTKKLVRREASSICHQQFANMFTDYFCAVHTHQHEFASFSLPCEGRCRNAYTFFKFWIISAWRSYKKCSSIKKSVLCIATRELQQLTSAGSSSRGEFHTAGTAATECSRWVMAAVATQPQWTLVYI